MVVDAMPGSTLTTHGSGGAGTIGLTIRYVHGPSHLATKFFDRFFWIRRPDDHVYGSCGNTPCNQFDLFWSPMVSRSRKWAETVVGNWVQQRSVRITSRFVSIVSDLFVSEWPDLLDSDSDNLAPGGYLIRHEIIALHLAQTQRSRVLPIHCQQVNVGGSKLAS